MKLPRKSDKIFIDSNYFISLFNAEDSLHLQAKSISKQLQQDEIELVCSNYIFLETVTVLSQRGSRQLSITAGTHLQNSPRLEITPITPHLHQLSWQIFQKIGRKNTSFVDCSIIAVIQAEGISKLLTFDTEDFVPLQKTYHFSLFKQ